VETNEKNSEKVFIEGRVVEWEQREHIATFFHQRFTIFMGAENTLVYES
jgi:hypothetical protein